MRKIILLLGIVFLSNVAWADPVDLNIIEPSEFIHGLIIGPRIFAQQQGQTFKLDSSGNLLVNCAVGCSGGGGGGGTSSLFGSTFPTSGTAAGFISSTGTMAGGNLDASGNLKVDFSNTTIAVTNVGTFAVQATLSAETTKVIGTVNQGTSPWIVAGGGTAGSPGTAALTIQGIGSGTPVPVSLASAPTTSVTQGTSPWVVSCTAANCAINNAQVNGVIVSTGAGATGTGTQRVGVAQDTTTIAGSAPGTAGSPSAQVVSVQGVTSGQVIPVTANAGTGQFNVTCTAANCPMNEAQINGVTPLMGNGVTGTGSQRVTVASDNTPFSVKSTDGTNTAIIDPCVGQVKVYKSFSVTVNTNLVTGTSAKKLYICHFNVVVGAATNVALVEGTTGATCGSGTAGLLSGGTTAATGWNFAANGGIALGDGAAAVDATATNNDDICIFVSAANQTSGLLTYVVQ